MGAMVMAFSTRGGSFAHPFRFLTSPWFFPYHCRAISGSRLSSDVRPLSYTQQLADVYAKNMWISAMLTLRCAKIQHHIEIGKKYLPPQDVDPKLESGVSKLGGLVDRRNNVLANDFQGTTPQVSPCSSRYSCGGSCINEYAMDYIHEQSVSFSGTDGRMLLQSTDSERSSLDAQGLQNVPVVAAADSVYGEDAHSKKTSVHGNHIGISSKMLLSDENLDKVVDQKRLASVYDKVIVVHNLSTAKEVVGLLTSKYKNFVHACDTEVAGIDVKSESPVGHGKIICFSIYCGPFADFGNGRSCIWVDVLDGGRNLLMEFAPFFEDSSIKKVWHNYSFDSHVLENYGIKPSGFYADTMHLARLLDSSRRDAGYSLEALTNDLNIMSSENSDTVDELSVGKKSMRSIFGKKKQRKDGSEGNIITIAPVDVLQRNERMPWICYSACDSLRTLELFNSLKEKLKLKTWTFNGDERGTMYDFYEQYWRPFGSLLVQMESGGMLVDRKYLSKIEKLAISEQQIASDKFRAWASKYCPDAKFMNIGSDAQIRQLLFGNISKRKGSQIEPDSKSNFQAKSFRVPNSENVSKEGKKSPRYRSIVLHQICKDLEVEMYTDSGLPSVCGDALKVFAGKVAADHFFLNGIACTVGEDSSSYGTAYEAFGGGMEGREACQAIAALCEVCSIDSLVSNFILPLQGEHISCANGRVHCSLNINTETGRLSARRPNLQNQPALEKDRYKIRQAFIAEPGNSLIVADYGQLELRILAHLANCKSMLEAFKAGGDFHSRTAMNMYAHVRKAVEENRVLLEWHPQPGEDKPPVPLLKDAFAAERRKAKTLNFSIAYGKTPVGLSRDWKVSVEEARETVKLWYKDRPEVRRWQEERIKEASQFHCVKTLLGRSRNFPRLINGHIERAAINTPVQGSAADVAMCAMLEIDRNIRLKELGWRLLLQVHDEVILEGPTESAELAKSIVIECMCKPFDGKNLLNVDLAVDAKIAQNWYEAK